MTEQALSLTYANFAADGQLQSVMELVIPELPTICKFMRSPYNGNSDMSSKELRERLGVDDIALVLRQNRLRWYGHVLRKDDDDWVKKCMEHEVEGSRPRGRPKKT